MLGRGKMFGKMFTCDFLKGRICIQCNWAYGENTWKKNVGSINWLSLATCNMY